MIILFISIRIHSGSETRRRENDSDSKRKWQRTQCCNIHQQTGHSQNASDGTGPSVGAGRVCYYYTARQLLCITSAAARKVFVGGRERAQAIVRGMYTDGPAGLVSRGHASVSRFSRFGTACFSRRIVTAHGSVTLTLTGVSPRGTLQRADVIEIFSVPPSVFRFRFRVAPSAFRVPCPLASSHRFCCPAVSLATA